MSSYIILFAATREINTRSEELHMVTLLSAKMSTLIESTISDILAIVNLSGLSSS